MATLTINHYINEANGFITDIRDNRNGYYMFAARPQPWANSTGGNDDTAVLATNTSVAQVEQTIYDDILYGKLLQDGDVSYVVPRNNWTANTVYASYNQNDASLYSKAFFVVTDNFEVYKCIDNNNGANSTIKPSLTATSGVFKTGDGYTWKYMYTIDAASNTKFTTSGYVPVVANAAVSGNATPGSIDIIKVTSGGNGYVVYENGYINGVFGQSIVQLPSSSSNTDDYYVNSSIYLKSGFGAGQIREIASSNGVTKQILLKDPIETYSRLDLANVQGTITTGYFAEQTFDQIDFVFARGYFNIGTTVTQSDTGVSASVISANTSVMRAARFISNAQFVLGTPIVDTTTSGILESGTVSVGNTGACNVSFVVLPGSGYTANATVTISNTGPTGSGAAANAQANSTGRIAAINITAVGSGYFVAPSIVISDPANTAFNANSAVSEGPGGGANSVITLSSAARFAANDQITYTVAAGNTAIGGLANGTTYFVEFANNTVVALKTTLAGSRITLTKGPTQTGHALKGQTATGLIFCDNQVVRGAANSFNVTANTTGVSNTADTLLITSANTFMAVNDVVYYNVPAGNTAIPNLTANASYFVTFANSSAIALSTSLGGTNVNIAETRTGAGQVHQILTGAVLNREYANNDYIRIGANTTSNIRRIANVVNTSVLVVTQPFSNSFTATTNQHFRMPTAIEPTSIVISGANGYISNTNLTSVQISITNSSIAGRLFSVGEKVNMTDAARVNQGANAIIAYSNTSTVILSSVAGSWQSNSGGVQFFVSGESTQQLSQISQVVSNPNITLNEPRGTFFLGYPLIIKTIEGGSTSGNATLVAKFDLPNDQTEYQIGPTVLVRGDGSNTVAIAVVNTAANSSYEVVGVDIINPGSGYTEANVTIYANTNYGSGAVANAIIAPVNGHGFDPVTELGARYVGINSSFDTLSNENYKFLGYGQYRKVGIIENPQFKDIRVTLTDFDRANFTMNVASYTSTLGWTPGEVAVQSTTNAAGVVVFGNSSFLQLKNVKGTFNQSNTIYGYFSNTTANVISYSINRFPVGNTSAIVTQSNSGAVGTVISVVNNTTYFMSNVVGQFADGDVMYDNVANAYATVDTIFTANGTVDSSADFGNKFNQTARITLTAVSGNFVANEFVQQDVTLARGRVVSYTQEKDLLLTSVSGSFTPGQTITDTTTNANGICTFANSSYIRLTNVSQALSFVNGDSINNGLGSTATISQVLPVLVLSDVSDVNNFQVGNNIVGQTSGASGTSNNHLFIRMPDLVRDSGSVIYLESFAPVTRSATSKEEVKLVIKF